MTAPVKPWKDDPKVREAREDVIKRTTHRYCLEFGGGCDLDPALDALCEAVAAACVQEPHPDSVRLDWLADVPICDGIGALDLHEVAHQVAIERDDSGWANETDYRVAFRRLIDAYDAAKGEP